MTDGETGKNRGMIKSTILFNSLKQNTLLQENNPLCGANYLEMFDHLKCYSLLIT